MMSLQPFLERLPLVAILRGVTPEEAPAIGRALVDAGFAIIEVPLNSPEPIESIRRLAMACGRGALIGAGTVMAPADVETVAEAGGRIIVMPHADPSVIAAAKARSLVCTPGIATPTEGFAALAAGADALKLFPAEAMPPPVLRALISVFPRGTRFLPVGGITPQSMQAYVEAGAAGFGLGSALYRPGMSSEEIGARAAAFAAAWRGLAISGPPAKG
jgi:2-dehydro-3-deoxyphosphogalactonate aldolase